jgi:hypothetical protein
MRYSTFSLVLFFSALVFVANQAQAKSYRFVSADKNPALMFIDNRNSLAADELVGLWVMDDVKCMPSNTAPSIGVKLDIEMTPNSFMASGTIARIACRVKGSYNFVNPNIAFKVTDSAACPIWTGTTTDFSAVVTGNKAVVTLPSDAARFVCRSGSTGVNIFVTRQ